MKDRFLVLAGGEIYKGKAFGAENSALGKLVFHTAMVGYAEVLSDPASYGQILLQTFPVIGARGVSPEEFNAKIHLSGYVLGEYAGPPSDFWGNFTLDAYLKKYAVPGIYGVDTRAITKILAEKGAVNALLCDEIPEDFSQIENFRIQNALKNTASGAGRFYPGKGNHPYRVALPDYGAAGKILPALLKRGCEVKVLPYFTGAGEVRAFNPDILVLSDGGGDPRDNAAEIRVISELLGEYPIFGIGLGQEMFILAAGGKVCELKNGHRGGSVPVRHIDGRTYMTSQNRGFAVSRTGLTEIGGAATFVNAHDGTLAGVDFPSYRGVTVCFHPEDLLLGEGVSFIMDKIFPESRCDGLCR